MIKFTFLHNQLLTSPNELSTSPPALASSVSELSKATSVTRGPWCTFMVRVEQVGCRRAVRHIHRAANPTTAAPCQPQLWYMHYLLWSSVLVQLVCSRYCLLVHCMYWVCWKNHSGQVASNDQEHTFEYFSKSQLSLSPKLLRKGSKGSHQKIDSQSLVRHLSSIEETPLFYWFEDSLKRWNVNWRRFEWSSAE